MAENAINSNVDAKYYEAVVSLLEKGYFLDDISASLLKVLSENKGLNKGMPSRKKAPAKKEAPVKKESQPKKDAYTKRKTDKNTQGKNKKYNRYKKPLRKAVKNENSIS